jgi:phytanoyl-CoA hydroxylase
VKHPWNADFEWVDHAGPCSTVSTDQARQFDEEGFFVLPEAFSSAEVAAIRDEVDRFEADIEETLRARKDQRISIAEAGAITFTTHLVAKSTQLRNFSKHELLAGLCADLVGPDVNLYWDQAVYKKPEKPRRFPWHQDNGYTFVEPQQYLTCWVALTDATVDNGCPQVAPGLHRAGTLAHTYVDPLGFQCFEEPPGRIAVAEVAAGGIVVFSSLTPHLTGPNTTTETRKADILQYAPADARTLTGVPPEPPAERRPCDDPDRQYPVVRNGTRV